MLQYCLRNSYRCTFAAGAAAFGAAFGLSEYKKLALLNQSQRERLEKIFDEHRSAVRCSKEMSLLILKPLTSETPSDFKKYIKLKEFFEKCVLLNFIEKSEYHEISKVIETHPYTKVKHWLRGVSIYHDRFEFIENYSKKHQEPFTIDEKHLLIEPYGWVTMPELQFLLADGNRYDLRLTTDRSKFLLDCVQDIAFAAVRLDSNAISQAGLFAAQPYLNMQDGIQSANYFLGESKMYLEGKRIEKIDFDSISLFLKYYLGDACELDGIWAPHQDLWKLARKENPELDAEWKFMTHRMVHEKGDTTYNREALGSNVINNSLLVAMTTHMAADRLYRFGEVKE
jgi:hypothetical protein